MRKKWPTKKEIHALQMKEYKRADSIDDIADPICQCGEPSFACRCDDMVIEIGYWPDGTPYNEEDE